MCWMSMSSWRMARRESVQLDEQKRDLNVRDEALTFWSRASTRASDSDEAGRTMAPIV
jgi:hypothetical protein